jgi:hypothetical protein
MVMVRLTQELLRPGAYRLANGRTGRLTREHLALVAENSRALLENGYEIPVLKRHSAKGAAYGGPRKPCLDGDHLDAQRVGRVVELSQREDGSLHEVLDIEDEASARDFESGAMRHTSAELRPTWTDEEGLEHGPIVAHVALTTAPRHVAQPPAELLSEAVQFSLEEIEGVADSDAIRRQLDNAKIPAGLRERIWQALTARQFSAESDEPALALGEVLIILEAALPPQWRQTMTPAAHVDGEAFFTGASLSDERADAIARQQLVRAGLDR